MSSEFKTGDLIKVSDDSEVSDGLYVFLFIRTTLTYVCTEDDYGRGCIAKNISTALSRHTAPAPNPEPKPMPTLELSFKFDDSDEPFYRATLPGDTEINYNFLRQTVELGIDNKRQEINKQNK